MQGGRLQPEPDKVAPNRLVHHGWMARQPKNDAIGWWNPTTSGANAPSLPAEMTLRAQRGCPHDPSFVKHRWSDIIKERMAYGLK